MPSYSSYPPISNPYSQRKQTPAALLKSLTKNAGVPPLAMVQSIQQQLTQQSTQWTLEMAQDVSSVFKKTFDPSYGNCPSNGNLQGSVAILNLLLSSMTKWNDSICYAVLVDNGSSQDIDKNLLNLLISLVAREDVTKYAALVGVSMGLRALDRIQQVTVLDPNKIDAAWWLTEGAIDLLTRITIGILENGTESEMMSDEFIDGDQRKLAAVSILSHLMKYYRGHTSAYYSEDTQKALCSRLIRDARLLAQPNLPPTANSITLSTAMQSLALLCLIQWGSDVEINDGDQSIHSPSMVEHIIHFVFPSSLDESHTHRPQWTWSNNDSQAQGFALDLVYCWSICNNSSWKLFQQQAVLWENFVERTWFEIVTNKTTDKALALQKLVLLHSTCRLHARRVLNRTIEHLGQDTRLHGDPYRAMVAVLSEMSKNENSDVGIYSARIFFMLLSDRKSIHTDDDLSRALWNAVDYGMVEVCLMGTLERASTDDVYQPHLLVLLDLLSVLFSSLEFCDATLNQLGAQSLERIIYLVKPKEIKFDFMALLDDSDCEDENTPPANNLSRLDETSICMEQEDEKVARGIDHTVRLSAALVLSRLGYHSSLTSDEGTGVLVSRIRQSVMEFLSTLYDTNGMPGRYQCCLDYSKRCFRLQTAAAIADNEDFIASIIHERHLSEHRKRDQLKQEIESHKQKLAEASKREDRLLSKQNKYENLCRSQTFILQRELTKQEERLTEDARQQLAMHVSERSKTERKCAELEELLRQVEDAAQTAREKEATCRNQVNQLEQQLGEVRSRTSELESENTDVKQQLHDEIVKYGELRDQMNGMSEEMKSLGGRCNELEDEVDYYRGDNKNLLNNLEDLFADMISLAQVYQHLEKEKESQSKLSARDIDDLRQKLSKETGKNCELEEKVSSLKTENEKLFRKLSKYKEKLEEEKRSREEEKQRRKRNGPVSYINQLHESQKPSRNDREKESQRSSRNDRDKSHRATSSGQGKENSSSYYAYASSASQRRKPY